MTDNELNALVAERVMELRNVRVMHGQTVYDMIHTYAIDNNGQESITYQPAPIPNYCNDIAAAWGVLEYLCTQRSLWYTIEGGDRDGYEVAIEGAGHGECWCVKRISKLPRAICLVGVEVE